MDGWQRARFDPAASAFLRVLFLSDPDTAARLSSRPGRLLSQLRLTAGAAFSGCGQPLLALMELDPAVLLSKEAEQHETEGSGDSKENKKSAFGQEDDPISSPSFSSSATTSATFHHRSSARILSELIEATVLNSSLTGLLASRCGMEGQPALSWPRATALSPAPAPVPPVNKVRTIRSYYI